MSVPVNGTQAKEVALHFLEKTNDRLTPTMVKRAIGQTKTIMACGYTKEEMIKVIDYLLDVKCINLYSIGYLSSAINNVLEEIKSLEYNLVAGKISDGKEFSEEVKTDEDSSRRNREKGQEFGTDSRLREKYNFDMLKGHGETD